jgi:hypothetical protein
VGVAIMAGAGGVALSFLPRRHHSLVGLLSTQHVVGFPLVDLLDRPAGQTLRFRPLTCVQLDEQNPEEQTHDWRCHSEDYR